MRSISSLSPNHTFATLTTPKDFPVPVFSESPEQREFFYRGWNIVSFILRCPRFLIDILNRVQGLPVDVNKGRISLSTSHRACALLNLGQGEAHYIRCSDADKEVLENLYFSNARKWYTEAVNQRKFSKIYLLRDWSLSQVFIRQSRLFNWASPCQSAPGYLEHASSFSRCTCAAI